MRSFTGCDIGHAKLLEKPAGANTAATINMTMGDQNLDFAPQVDRPLAIIEEMAAGIV